MNLCLGTAQFGMPYGIANTSGQVLAREINSILDLALDKGVKSIDTAALYGSSEEVLGRANVGRFNVISKLPELPDNVDDVTCWIEKALEKSLTKLGVDQLYGLLLHRPMDILGDRGEQITQALAKLKSKGLITKFGISIYQPQDLDILWPKGPFDIVQCPYNIFDRRLVTSGWISRLKDAGVELHIRSIFLQGALLMPLHSLPQHLQPHFSKFKDFNDWLAENEMTAIQACIQHVLSIPEIDQIIVGIDCFDHLTEILQLMQKTPVKAPDTLISENLNLIEPNRWGK